MSGATKNLGNSPDNPTKKNVPDLVVYGIPDVFKLISKASSQKEGWMKSTKAMEIEGVGCVVQVSTQQRNETAFSAFEKDENGECLVKHGELLNEAREANSYVIAEALTFVPNCKILEEKNKQGKVISRRLVSTLSDHSNQNK